MLGVLEDPQYKDGEDWPIELPGEKDVISSNEIWKYVDHTFYHYYDFFIQMKYCGMPWVNDGWIEKPLWVRQLFIAFTNTFTVVENHRLSKLYKK